MALQNPCPDCKGQKWIASPDSKLYQACPNCGGTGRDPGIEIPFQYVWDGVLPAAVAGINTFWRGVGVTLLGEADFVWKALAGVSTGIFRIRFGFGGGGYMSSGGAGVVANDLVNNANIVGTALFPFPIWPFVTIPRSGKLLFDIEDLTAVQNTVQLCFIGALLYPSG